MIPQVNEERRDGPDRRRPFFADEAKFSTQRVVTYIVLLIFSAVTVNVLFGIDQAERSTILQTVINLTFLACGFWLGASKVATDAARVPPVAPIAPLAAIAPIAPIAAIAPIAPVVTQEEKKP